MWNTLDSLPVHVVEGFLEVNQKPVKWGLHPLLPNDLINTGGSIAETDMLPVDETFEVFL